MSDTFFENLLTQTCIIKSRNLSVSTKDSWGVPIETISTTDSSESCLIQQSPTVIEISKQGKRELATHHGFFKYSATINLDDVIILNGISYQVLSVNDPMVQHHHKEVLLKQLENS